jgi:hypothetical protein
MLSVPMSDATNKKAFPLPAAKGYIGSSVPEVVLKAVQVNGPGLTLSEGRIAEENGV